MIKRVDFIGKRFRYVQYFKDKNNRQQSQYERRNNLVKYCAGNALYSSIPLSPFLIFAYFATV